ncbi:LysR family transcriptional regulator [Bradyrhizobium sp. Pear76]|uniref:LysR family transcriptional regulator n=1 Tax=Bradyrhizobium oropedii TaxID=1571201 RepID=UPI001E4AEA4D|nr:LysR family transcriptional regulator [Bradyrhizobium oropedii]MCC8967748.1 LysR family transcriptional regulator [Bradyrhizobium oropedii]
MDKNPGWELYRSFLAVLREGSLSGAARSLNLTQPTVGRHIRELEVILGVPLFTRAQDGLRPTAASVVAQPHALAMAAAAETLLRTISGTADQPRTVVRIAASEIVAAEILPAIVMTLEQSQPGLVVEISASDRTEDLLRRDCDIAIRMARPTQSNLVARKVGQARLGFYAHLSYVQKNGKPSDLREMNPHRIIGFDRETEAVRALRRLGLPLKRDDFTLRSDNHLVQLAAIRAGLGIGICQCAVARKDSALVHILPEAFSPRLDVWVAKHQDLRNSRPMRLMFDHLVDALKAAYQPG